MDGRGEAVEQTDVFARLNAKSFHEELNADETSLLCRELLSDSATSKIVLLQALGHASPACAPAVAQFIEQTTNDQAAAYALGVLVQNYDRGWDYRAKIVDWLSGSDSENSELLLGAIGCVGVLLHDRWDGDLAERLLKIHDDPDRRAVMRAAALYAMGDALHEAWAARSGFTTAILNDADVGRRLTGRIRQRLEEKGDEPLHA